MAGDIALVTSWGKRCVAKWMAGFCCRDSGRGRRWTAAETAALR